MRWYNHLYVGKKARRGRYAIIEGIREGKPRITSYVITLPQNGNNLFDIYPSAVLLQPYYQEQDLMILGIAADYWEALEVARTMVEDLYRDTGEFSRSYFMEDE